MANRYLEHRTGTMARENIKSTGWRLRIEQDRTQSLRREAQIFSSPATDGIEVESAVGVEGGGDSLQYLEKSKGGSSVGGLPLDTTD